MKSHPWLLSLLILIGILAGLPRVGRTPTTGLSTDSVNLKTAGVGVEIMMAGPDVMLARSNIETVSPADVNRDGKLNQEEFMPAPGRLRKGAAECLGVAFDGQMMLPGQASRHGDVGRLSFADGHAERLRWMEARSKTLKGPGEIGTTSKDRDWQRMQEAIYGAGKFSCHGVTSS